MKISSKYPTQELITHVAFFFTRIACFSALRYFTGTPSRASPVNRSIISDVIFSYQFCVYQLYLLLKSIFTDNTYAYYLATVIIFHNGLLTFSVLTLVLIDANIRARYWITVVILGVTYFIELGYALIRILITRQERNMKVFKQIGGDPRINEIYSTRMKLSTLGEINMFFPAATAGRLFLPPIVRDIWADYLAIVVLGLTVIQQLFISVNFYEESVVQRKIAIGITILKGGFAVLMIVIISLLPDAGGRSTKSVKLLTYIDILVITVVVLYYLINDLRRFGSGLKSRIQLRTRTIFL